MGSRSVRMHLAGLRKSGLVETSGDGYVITEKGKENMGFPRVDAVTAERLLGRVSRDNVFYFYAGIERPLDVSSDGLVDLCEKIKSISVGSIEFHLGRGDFESWIRFLGDFELEKRLNLLRSAGLAGEALRERLYCTIKSRCDELLRVTA